MPRYENLHFCFCIQNCEFLYTMSRKAWKLAAEKKKKKVGRCYFVICHMFCELFIIEEGLRRPLFLTPLTKACPSLLKNHTQQHCLPGFVVLMKIWSSTQKLSGKMPEICLPQMFQQKVLACLLLIWHHTGLSVTTAI